MRHPCRYCGRHAAHGDLINGTICWLCDECFLRLIEQDQAHAPDIDLRPDPSFDQLAYRGCD